MSDTTGPVLAIGAITVANRVLLNDEDFDIRIPIATAIAAGGFFLAEKVSARGATMLAWTALVAVLLTRVDPTVPSPVESLQAWWKTQ